MKRIFSILLLLCLMLCLAVPTLADDTVELKPGTYTLPQYLYESALPSYCYANFDFIISGTLYTQMDFQSSSNNYVRMFLTPKDGSKFEVGTSNGKNGIPTDYRTFTVPYSQNVSSVFGNYINNNAVYEEFKVCSGIACETVDTNEDNICDTCGLPVSFNLRNDTYLYNGHSFPRMMELEDDSTVDIFDYWEQLGGLYNFVILSRTGNFDSALFYLVAPNVEFINGNAVTSAEDTNIILFKASYTEDGTPYWKYEATDIWGTKGALLAPKDQVLWSAKTIVSGDSSADIIEGDPNFMMPLWEMVEKVTQGEMPKMTDSLIGSVTNLVVCGICLMALLVALVLLRRKSLLFLR